MAADKDDLTSLDDFTLQDYFDYFRDISYATIQLSLTASRTLDCILMLYDAYAVVLTC